LHVGKLSYINSTINTQKPHVLMLSESKTNTKMSSSLPFSDYNIFEEPGIKTAGDHPYKWGLVMGIHKDIQISQRLTLSQDALVGCVIALDIVLAMNSG
ncbi:hypothetical protein L208DRAFT_1276116, partial [Tricholoma matsutake]